MISGLLLSNFPSHSGPWNTVEDDDNDFHVIPGFGPAHELSDRCWCYPAIDRSYEGLLVLHNVPN